MKENLGKIQVHSRDVWAFQHGQVASNGYRSHGAQAIEDALSIEITWGHCLQVTRSMILLKFQVIVLFSDNHVFESGCQAVNEQNMIFRFSHILGIGIEFEMGFQIAEIHEIFSECGKLFARDDTGWHKRDHTLDIQKAGSICQTMSWVMKA